MTKIKLDWKPSKGAFFWSFEEYQEIHWLNGKETRKEARKYAIVYKGDIILDARLSASYPYMIGKDSHTAYLLDREEGEHVSLVCPKGNIYPLKAISHYAILDIAPPEEG